MGATGRKRGGQGGGGRGESRGRELSLQFQFTTGSFAFHQQLTQILATPNRIEYIGMNIVTTCA